MKLNGLLGVASLFFPALAWAVYAPIPEQEQGKALTVTIDTNVYHDNNIFGSATGAISSMVYSIAPKVAFNASVSAQSFVSASYQPSLDYIENRPTDKSLVSHDLALRLAHEFSKVTDIDLTEAYQIEKNPRSLLAGIPLNSDQSFKRNEFDSRFTTALTQKTSVVLKYRNVDYSYDDPLLSQALDRMEHLGGLELDNQFLPEIALVGEYRYQLIDYAHAGGNNDKNSNFLLGGADYVLGKQFTLSGRAGLEDRQRDGERNTTAPYVELTCRYDYAKGSFVTGGYTYSFQETDNPDLFTDSKVNQVFVNVQHAVTSRITASGSIAVAPSVLQGRRGLPNINETGTQLGLALTYIARKNFTVSATYDYDRVNSDAANREQNRTRFGVNARLYF